jgi:hypothetical protein
MVPCDAGRIQIRRRPASRQKRASTARRTRDQRSDPQHPGPRGSDPVRPSAAACSVRRPGRPARSGHPARRGGHARGQQGRHRARRGGSTCDARNRRVEGARAAAGRPWAPAPACPSARRDGKLPDGPVGTVARARHRFSPQADRTWHLGIPACCGASYGPLAGRSYWTKHSCLRWCSPPRG